MREMTCIVCPKGCRLKVYDEEELVVEGNGCKKGIEYAKEEINDPRRILTTTVRTSFKKMPRIPVKTDKSVPKRLLLVIMRNLDEITIDYKVNVGDIILENVLNTGANVVATFGIQ